MKERIAQLKVSADALQFAKNAERLGRPEWAALALERAKYLRALEEGYSTPAQQAISAALFAYEDEQSRITGRTFRANRTRQMIARRGALAAAEKMVLTRQPSKGYEVLHEAGLGAFSFEAIIDQFPDEFSEDAVAAARARLNGTNRPDQAGKRVSTSESATATALQKVASSSEWDAEAMAFLDGFNKRGIWFTAVWLPRYCEAILTIARALDEGRPHDIFDMVWTTHDNAISHAGQGLLKRAAVDAMRDDLLQVIHDISADGSSLTFESIIEKFEVWKKGGRFSIVPRLLIARAFAGIHPSRYHTTVDGESQNLAITWFAKHTGLTVPDSKSWAVRAQSIVTHLELSGWFAGDILARNIFPWFVVDQLRARAAPSGIPPGHRPRAETAFATMSADHRVVALKHNRLQTKLFFELTEQHGYDRVWTEYPTGTGGYADVVVREPNGSCHLYEIKVAFSASEVVRQAMGQLLEYAFREGGLAPTKLFAVGEPALDDVTSHFLARLRSDFRLELQYLQVTLADDDFLHCVSRTAGDRWR